MRRRSGPRGPAEACPHVPPTTAHLQARLWAQDPVPWEGPPQLSAEPGGGGGAHFRPLRPISGRFPWELLGAGPCLRFVSGPWGRGGRGPGTEGTLRLHHPEAKRNCSGEGVRQDAATRGRQRAKAAAPGSPYPPPSLPHVLSLNVFKCLAKIWIKNKNCIAQSETEGQCHLS